MWYKIWLSCLLYLFAFEAKCGLPFEDTTLILKNIKLRMVADLNLDLMSEEQLASYISLDLKVKWLESRGFDNYTFIQVKHQPLFKDTTLEKGFIISKYNPFCGEGYEDCCLVYAYNNRNKSIYNITGTKVNDFAKVYNNLSTYWIHWRPIKNTRHQTIKKFYRYFYIEGVNLKHLMRTIKINHKIEKQKPFCAP